MRPPESKGSAVATVLAGAWRDKPPRLEATTAGLAAIVPRLVESGTAALGWWRIHQAGGEQAFSGLAQLRATYLRYAVHAAEHESEIVDVFNALRSSGVEPILLKGWAIGRSYPEIGLRPSGDIDLCISPDQYAKAKAVLRTRPPSVYSVDLDHDITTRFSALTFEELYLRSQLVNLDGAEIRVPGAEDHLRILCLHMLKDGAWRPLWLCDVAAALESRPQRFDWNRCLGNNETQADWVLCSLALAGRLLGAETRATPAHGRLKTLPDWLVRSVLKRWNAPAPPNLPLFVEQVGQHWWKIDTLRAIRQRWPNPIQATVDAGGSFTTRSRFPFQVRDCISRTVRLCRRHRQKTPGLSV